MPKEAPKQTHVLCPTCGNLVPVEAEVCEVDGTPRAEVAQ